MATDVTSLTKSLDRIADALEGQSSGGSSSAIFRIGWHKVDSDKYGVELDKTLNEIIEALENGMVPVLFGEPIESIYENSHISVFSYYEKSNSNNYFLVGFGGNSFMCATVDDYPFEDRS